MKNRYKVKLNGKLMKSFCTMKDLAEYLVYSEVAQAKYRSVCFCGNTCEIYAYDNLT